LCVDDASAAELGPLRLHDNINVRDKAGAIPHLEQPVLSLQRVRRIDGELGSWR
jgi:hypothetical protein